MLRGPQGLSALAEKQQEIRRLELQNANLRRDNDRKKHRIDSLNHDPNAQELEIRKRLKLQRHGETSFVLPDRPNPPVSSDAGRDVNTDPPKQPLQ